MYEKFILSSLLKDFVLDMSFLIMILVVYFGFQLYRSKARGCALFFLIMFFGGLALLSFSIDWKYYVDYVNYLQIKDTYVSEKICFVEDVSAPTSASILYAAQNLRCADGTLLKLRYRRDYQRIYPKKGKSFRVRYLPKSGLIVELEPLDGVEGKETGYP